MLAGILLFPVKSIKNPFISLCNELATISTAVICKLAEDTGNTNLKMLSSITDLPERILKLYAVFWKSDAAKNFWDLACGQEGVNLYEYSTVPIQNYDNPEIKTID